jgi:hypothetical protein
MKFEIFNNGQLKWTIEAVGNFSPDDVMILPKSITKGASISAEGFDEIFYACMSGASSNSEAYEKAEELHVQYFEKRKYSDYNSFKSSRSNRLNR